MLPDGDVLMSFTFGVKGKPRDVCGVLCSFDGSDLVIKKTGPALSNSKGRGLLEPSITRFQNRIYLTIRAEDNRGYVSVSDDGLNYAPQQAWAWENGEPLDMSTTQQHWLTHSDGLFLVYTRKDADECERHPLARPAVGGAGGHQNAAADPQHGARGAAAGRRWRKRREEGRIDGKLRRLQRQRR